LRYVEALSDVRTPLEAFFNILLGTVLVGLYRSIDFLASRPRSVNSHARWESIRFSWRRDLC